MENPYESPRSEAEQEPDEKRDWEPNTWLTNWSLFLLCLFLAMDGLFLLWSIFRDSPSRFLIASLVVDVIVLSPVALMVYVDGLRAVRAAPRRVSIVVVLVGLHLWFWVYSGLLPMLSQ